MKCYILLLAVLITHVALAAAGADVQDDHLVQTLSHGGVVRTSYVHYPKNKLPDTPRALVIVLHGGGGADAATMAQRTGFNAIADREGFIVAYPAGVDGQWNDGRGKTFRRNKDNTDVDDVGFISSLIDLFVKKGEADANRIYVTGVSNGGMMTHRIGVELGTKVAAIAPVIANLPSNLAARQVSRPLSVLIMNGTDDPMMPWKGGQVRVLGKDYGTVLSTEQTVKYWIDAARLPVNPVKQLLEDLVPEDKCRVEVDTYSNAGQQAKVVLYAISGGGHNLPGSNTPDRPRLLGPKCMDINGPEVIWAFFARQSLAQPGAPADADKPRR